MRSKISCLLIFLFFTSTLKAQTDDFGIWTSIGIEKKLGNWDFAGETELRTKENTTAYDRWSIGLTSAYRIFKPIKIGGGYEFIYFNDTKYLDFQARHRANLFVQGKQKMGDFTFTLREKVQLTAKDVSDRVKENGKIDNYNVNPEYTWRNKLKINYSIPHFPVNPGISVESFYSLNNPNGNAFEQLRYTISLNYNLSKHQQLEVYGLYDYEFKVDDPIRRTVLGISYQYHF